MTRHRRYGRRVLRKVTGTTPSGHVHRQTGREYPIYHFECGHTRTCYRFDGIITHFLVMRAAKGEADYPTRKCYDCSREAGRVALQGP